MTNIELATIISTIAKGINPETGEYFDAQILADQMVCNSIKKLSSASRTVNKLGVIKHTSQNHLNRPSDKIFNQLRAWRLNKAQSLGMPAYIVFSDDDLWSIAEGDVIEKSDLLRVRGIGMYKYEKYGDQIYDILIPYITEDK